MLDLNTPDFCWVQEEKLSETGVALIPGGIHLCQLPFADDLRELGLSSTLSVVHRPGAAARQGRFCRQRARLSGSFLQIRKPTTSRSSQKSTPPRRS